MTPAHWFYLIASATVIAVAGLFAIVKEIRK